MRVQQHQMFGPRQRRLHPTLELCPRHDGLVHRSDEEQRVGLAQTAPPPRVVFQARDVENEGPLPLQRFERVIARRITSVHHRRPTERSSNPRCDFFERQPFGLGQQRDGAGPSREPLVNRATCPLEHHTRE